MTRSAWAGRAALSGDAEASLQQIVKFCLDHSASLKLAGDTFDSGNPDACDVKVFREQMALMADAGLPVYFIQGQHDMATPTWAEAISSHLQHVHEKVFYPMVGCAWYALDFLHAEQLFEALKQVPKEARNLMLHQMAKPVFDMPGAWNLDPEWLPVHVRYVAIGDFHKPVEFTFGDGSCQRAMYSGSMHMLAEDETPSKSFIHEQLVDGEVVAQRIPLTTRAWYRAKVGSTSQLNQLLEQLRSKILPELAFKKATLPAAIATPVLVVEYQDAVPDVQESLRKAVGQEMYLWPKMTSMRLEADEQAEAVEFTAEDDVNLATMHAAQILAGPVNVNNLAMLVDMLQCIGTPQVVIARWRGKMGVM